MWCENCKRQFETEEENCPECGNKLVDYTPILDEDAELFGINENDETASQEITTDEEIQIELEAKSQLLVTVIGLIEAKRIIKLLTENRIPAFEKVSAEQNLSGLDELDFDEDYDDDFFDDIELDDEDLIKETLTPPELAEDQVLDFEETLYDIFVPEADFPEAMSLMLEKDMNRYATIIDDLSDIIYDDDPFDDFFFDDDEPQESPKSKARDYYDDDDEIHEEQVDGAISEYPDEQDESEEFEESGESDEDEKSKGGFWNLFKK